jgi:serine/threonine protein kinase
VSRPSVIDSVAATLGARPGPQLPALRPPLVPGDLGACGTYRVMRLIGRGGMGAVYEAIDTALGRRVALKLMLPELAASEAGRERFLREARAAAAIRHENVVSVYAVGEDDGTPYMTMELLAGSPLEALIARGADAADVVRIGREVACGLAAAHALGVTHRDIKPANIWIEQPGGRVRLLDFGLARFDSEFSTIARNCTLGGDGLTEIGALIGTPNYMAPEQVTGDPVGPRTDLFALGAVLYQMATGRPPFGGRTLSEMADAILAGAFVPVCELAPGVPPDLAGLIHRMLATDPTERPPSAAAVAEELLAVGTRMLVSGGVSVVVPVVPAPELPEFEYTPTPPPQRRFEVSPRLLLGGAGALILAVVAAYCLAPRSEGTPPPLVMTPAPPTQPRTFIPPFAPVFNGHDLTGWHPAKGNPPEGWAVRDGAIVGTQQKGDRILLSDATYADFELRLEYRWPKPGGHTVVLLRAADQGDPLGDNLAVNIGDDEGFPAVHGRTIGNLYRTGLIQGVTFNPSAANRPINSWNDLRVFARKQTIEVKLNGTPMPTADLGKSQAVAKRPALNKPAGSIGLVCHWGTIEFRNIAVRPIND